MAGNRFPTRNDILLLLTSAFPHLKRFDEHGTDVGKELVGRCLRSWQDNGFRILSVHNKAEEKLLGDRFPGVEYRFVEENLGPGARKTPSFAAVLADLPAHEPVGIINADVFMAESPDFAERLSAAAADATVVMHRWEVPSLARRQGRRFDLGVDLLAFTPQKIAPALEAFTSFPYQLGVPWWDYAFPVAASLYAPLVLVDDPVLLHHTHDQAWNDGEWHRFAEISADFLKAQSRASGVDPKLAHELQRRLTRIERDHYGSKDPKEPNYALAELTIRWVHVLSERKALSLLSQMELPPSGRTLDDAVDDDLLEGLLSESLTYNSAEPSEAAEIRRKMPRREFKGPPPLALYNRVSTESSPWQVLRAGLRDLGLVFRSTGKLLERRFRRKRRGYS
jgi:hypothetical protein